MIFVFLIQILSFSQVSVSDSIYFWNGQKEFIYSSSVDTNAKQVDIIAELKKNKVKAEKGILLRKKNATNHWNLYATNSWYIYDAKGQAIINKDIIAVEPFENGILKIQTPNGDGLIDTDANPLSAFDYTEFKYTDGVLLGRKANVFNITNSFGNIINQIIDVDDIEAITKNLFKITVNKKVGIYDIFKNKYVLKPVFDQITFVTNIGYIIKKNKKYALMSFDGNILLPNEYDTIEWDTLAFFKCMKLNIQSHEQLNSLKIVDENWSLYHAKTRKMIVDNCKEIGKFNHYLYPILNQKLFALYDTSGKKNH